MFFLCEHIGHIFRLKEPNTPVVFTATIRNVNPAFGRAAPAQGRGDVALGRLSCNDPCSQPQIRNVDGTHLAEGPPDWITWVSLSARRAATSTAKALLARAFEHRRVLY